MSLTSELFFAVTAIVAGTVVAVGTAAIVKAVFAVIGTAVAPMNCFGSDGMNLRFSLYATVIESFHLCSSTGSRPGVGPRFSSSSPSFFCGYQNRACFYIL